MSKTGKIYDSALVAKYMLALAYSEGIVLNVTKVQKLLFITYGFFLAEYGYSFIEEKPKAWPYGPVFPRTRNKVSYDKIIPLDSRDFDEISQDEKVVNILKIVIKTFSEFTASQLSEWSHMKGSPWEKTTKGDGSDWNKVIPDQYISEYFSQFSLQV